MKGYILSHKFYVPQTLSTQQDVFYYQVLKWNTDAMHLCMLSICIVALHVDMLSVHIANYHLCRYSNSRGKSPHVVGHYAAGTRLIGLTEKQMAKRLTALNISGYEKQDSPYAQPLCTFATNVPGKLAGKREVGDGRIQLTVVKDGSRPKDKTTIQQEKKLLKAVVSQATQRITKSTLLIACMQGHIHTYN